ncbi:Inosine/uridine-preferring nucleoside hydrolase domain-containing protein [Crepidotus variabilis]|uniref:Inosine/uridine-preferring nucleoside hydrolase domain-containing protein n=1 Tax=Crepidotus variabilis TaxID=179855 RepID=A0A9P6JWJ5_9AGAR|nr:Inosine/uridine-preferring nucleoside hydrolase domain-containing protein [Crepidotus variabilis]
MKGIWLDVDPGHDDATALMLAVNFPNVDLLGVSTASPPSLGKTHGNAAASHTAINAARCLVAFGANSRILVYPGASQPLLLPAKHDPEIHGEDGLGGVEGLPDPEDPRVSALFAKTDDGSSVHAIEGMAKTIKSAWKNGQGHKVTIISTGPMTNIALFVTVYSSLLEAVEEFVFMGGGVGMGNRSAVAEYNILCDPHAAQIVLNVAVKKTMIPINVTHTAIVTREIHSRLLSPDSLFSVTSEHLPKAISPLRHTLSTIISYFASAYASTFGFAEGPPLHDALTIAYVAHPELFSLTRHRVDIELTGTHSLGETIVDVWKYKSVDDTWGRDGKNCLVADNLDVKRFFELFLDAVMRCDTISSLNSRS